MWWDSRFLPFFHSSLSKSHQALDSILKVFLMVIAAAAAKSLQSCLTLCDPIDGSPPGSPVPGILQARTLEWVAIAFFNAWKWKLKVKLLSRVRLFATPWTAAYQAPPPMGFSRQEDWSGVPLPCLSNGNREQQNLTLFVSVAFTLTFAFCCFCYYNH